MRQGDELGDEQLGELRSVEYLQGLKGFSSDLLAILKMSALPLKTVVSPEDLLSRLHCPTLNLHPPKQNLVCFWKLNRIYYTITPTYFSLQIRELKSNGLNRSVLWSLLGENIISSK